jgi:hypothetical protein
VKKRVSRSTGSQAGVEAVNGLQSALAVVGWDSGDTDSGETHTGADRGERVRAQLPESAARSRRVFSKDFIVLSNIAYLYVMLNTIMSMTQNRRPTAHARTVSGGVL